MNVLNWKNYIRPSLGRGLGVGLLMLSSLSLSAKSKPGKELSGLLLSYMQLEEVHPDSLERNIDSLKQCRMQTSSDGERAVYAAAIARLYGERISWRSVGNDLRDSMLVWYGRALADKQVLATEKAKRWKSFVVVGRDEDYFGGDMLNVVWRSMVGQVDKSVRDTSRMLPNVDEMAVFYNQRGLREGALLLALHALDDQRKEVTAADLLPLCAAYADVPLCAEVYLRLGTETDTTVFQHRAWLQQGLQLYPKYRRRAALQNALTRLSDPFMQWNGPTCVYPGQVCKWVFTARNVQSVTINGEEHTFPVHDPIETFTDTMVWTAPRPGRYKLAFVPHTRAKLTEKVKPLEKWVDVTTLQPVYQQMPDSSVRLLVVDIQSGHPKKNVEVRAYRPTNDWKDTVAYFVGRTGTDGMLRVPLYKGDGQRWRQQLMHKITSPDTADYVLSTRYFNSGYGIGRWEGAPKDSTHVVRLFTDRAIYRPGQTVHVSAIEYSQLDWEARAAAGQEHTLVLYDASRKRVDEKAVSSDEMGVFCADFELPAGGKNGSFSIVCDNKHYTYFRVEEYKRPTFEVVLDDSLYVRGDSCEVRGTARNYDGSALRSARVTGTYRWTVPWVYSTKRRPQSESLPLDTVETDDRGRFVYVLATPSDRIALRRSLSVNVDVLSQQGETHNAQHWYWRSREPQPKPEPERVDSTFLVRCVTDTFAIGTPGRIEVTTTLRDACLFYTLAAAGRVWKNEMVRLNNETFALDIPYREEYDQSVAVSFCMVRDGRVYNQNVTIWLRQPDNRLRLHWDTFRDLLQPGQQEEWRLSVRRPDGQPAAANVMLAMYDASLDYFTSHDWHFDVSRRHRLFSVPYQASSRLIPGIMDFGSWFHQKTRKERPIALTDINAELFQVRAYTRAVGGRMYYKAANTVMLTSAAPMAVAESSADMDDAGTAMRLRGTEEKAVMREVAVTEEQDDAEEETLSVPMRENFDETAFFYPRLHTDQDGQVAISFTLPESLTRWHLMGVAHTTDMLYANLGENIEARKDLMAQLYLPRFLRPGDEASLSATVRNVSDEVQTGRGTLQVLDAKTERVLRTWKTDIRLEAKRDTALFFGYVSPDEDVIVRWAVEGTTCSDGEQRLLPVMPATMHVTNTVALTAYDPSVQNIDLSDIFPKDVTDRRLTVEYTTHPEQLALQTLPALAQAKHNDVLSLAAAYYAGVLGKALGAEMPDSTEEYLHRMSNLQDANGGFRWYPEMPVSPYLTREVCYLLARLQMLTGNLQSSARPEGTLSPSEANERILKDRAVHYLLDQRIDSTYLSTADLRTLYIAQYAGVTLSKEEQKKVNFLLKLAKREDVEEDGYERQALLAIVLKEAGADRKARKCANAFRQYIVSSPQRGSYIEFPKGSFTSIDRKLHIHVQMMEALQRLNPEDTLLRGMRRYLLQQKRTQEWSTPVNSANAIFALMNNGEMVKSSDAPMPKDLLTLTRNRSAVQNFTAKDDTLGYLRDSVNIDEHTLPVRLRLHKLSKGESWGAVYADFEQRYDQVGARSEGLSIRAEYPTDMKKGNRYTVSYYLSADRDYEYVTLVVPRPAATEPVDQRSGYRWSGAANLLRRSIVGWGGGLGYYRQVHDATTELSFHQIPRGEYLIEEDLYVERDGTYHTGVSVIRCEYADEFQGHSSDTVVRIEN